MKLFLSVEEFVEINLEISNGYAFLANRLEEEIESGVWDYISIGKTTDDPMKATGKHKEWIHNKLLKKVGEYRKKSERYSKDASMVDLKKYLFLVPPLSCVFLYSGRTLLKRARQKVSLDPESAGYWKEALYVKGLDTLIRKYGPNAKEILEKND